ncbi:hypothetical protein R5R35_003527 [Gryllus longicercus]|uniref:Superoxide dismutase copper/zinc binding domain-containing protein n=1 Tax=Gryllus longicercus TaxID=2509291 RepID=A0AAN9Z869_9ORTH
MTTRSSRRAVLLTSLSLLTWLTAPAAGAPAPLARPRLRHPTASDRTLHIRSLPAVNGVASNVYEVLMRPYHFEVPALTAVAELTAAPSEAEGAAGGSLLLSQPHPPVGPLLITGNLTGLPAGRLALQVRRWGDLRDGCDGATGPQFDPYMAVESAPDVLPAPRALGDVGPVEADAEGAARVHLLSGLLALSGPHSVVGRALVLRELPPADAAGAAAAAASVGGGGGGGKAIACGVVALARYHPPPPPPPPPMHHPPPKNPEAEAAAGAGAERLDRP